MKRKINILYLLSSLLFLGSCLDEEPKYTTTENVIYSSEQSAQLALNGIYGLMAVQGSFAQLLPEINTEASGLCWTSFNPSDNRCQYTNGVIPVDNEFNNLVWGALYQAIANCNIFIEACNSDRSAEWSSKANMVAQAKFLRGVCYYSLYTFYGGVPLRLEPANKENLSMPRASRQEVLDQIEKDWREAIPDLSSTSSLSSSSPTAPCKASAYAYLAKLYWLMGCNSWAAEQGDRWATGELKRSWPEMKSSREYFTQAKVYGDSVFSANVFDLEKDFRTLFNGQRLNFSKEFVFVIDATMNTTENVGYNSLHWTFSPQNCSPGETWGRSQPNKSFYNWARGTYQDDPRLKVTFVSQWVKYINNAPSKEIQAAYPYVLKSRLDTIGWEEVVVVPGRPPIKKPITEIVQAIVDSIDYSDFERYADVTNPQPAELDSLLEVTFCQTKTADSWNINDWPYFGKYMTTNCSGRYADNNLYVYRYADFLLLIADVENELGNTGRAIELVNLVLQRARNSAATPTTYPKDLQASMSQDEVRRYIFHERLFELAAEFDGFTDTRRRGIEWRKNEILMRNNNDGITAACYNYGVNVGYSSPWREYWYPNDGSEDWDSYLIRNQLIPIPRMEMSSNDQISLSDQNPGY